MLVIFCKRKVGLICGEDVRSIYMNCVGVSTQDKERNLKSVLEHLCALEEFIKGTRKKFEECSRKAGRPCTMSKNSKGARKA